MKKNIVIVALLLGMAGAVQSGQEQSGRTWGQWFGGKAGTVNRMVNPYQYERREMPKGETLERGRRSLAASFLAKDHPLFTGKPLYRYGIVKGFNPYIHRVSLTPENAFEERSFELPVRETLIAGAAYLTGRWIWNKFMISDFKKIENKASHMSKISNELEVQIIKAQTNKNATGDDLQVLGIYKNAAEACKQICNTMKTEIKNHLTTKSSNS